MLEMNRNAVLNNSKIAKMMPSGLCQGTAALVTSRSCASVSFVMSSRKPSAMARRTRARRAPCSRRWCWGGSAAWGKKKRGEYLTLMVSKGWDSHPNSWFLKFVEAGLGFRNSENEPWQWHQAIFPGKDGKKASAEWTWAVTRLPPATEFPRCQDFGENCGGSTALHHPNWVWKMIFHPWIKPFFGGPCEIHGAYLPTN